MTRVTSQTLRQTAEQLDGMNQQLKSKAEEFTNAGNTLFTKWEGDTKQAEQKVFQDDRTQIDNFCALIQEYVTALNNIAAIYDKAEGENLATAGERKY
ncbi:MAG: WXG100 family type VII secretion target [Lachnospiraceae bacterium]|nr:WXG100 family type VII secretion target [Lachnospiraceae bacterium]